MKALSRTASLIGTQDNQMTVEESEGQFDCDEQRNAVVCLCWWSKK